MNILLLNILITGVKKKTYYKVTIQDYLISVKEQEKTDQRKRIKSPKTNSYKYSQLILDKEANKIQWRKK